jgi:NADH-quinone oxidoreductase subunit G
VHDVFGRLPGGRAIELGRADPLIGVDSDPVNWGWLCDKGRFAFASASSPQRVSVPLVRRGDELVETSWAEALAVAAKGLAAAKAAGGGRSLAVIGGSRLPNEDAYAWAKAARVVLGTDNVDAQLGDGLPATTVLGLPRATIDQAAAAPLVITLGPDIKDELPVLYLRLRDAVRERGTQIVELTPAPTGLSPYAAETVVYRPGEVAALAAAVVGTAPVTGDVAACPRHHRSGARPGFQGREKRCEPGAPSLVVILGRPSLAESEDQVAAAARILADLPGVAFLSALRRGNVHGALDLGLAPASCPAASASRLVGPGTSTSGARPCPPARSGHGGHNGRGQPGPYRRPWCCSAPTRAPTFPTPRWP